jgi:hypothetical protein
MRHKQNTPIYLVTSIGNIDNSVDLSDEAPQTFDSKEKALKQAKEITDEYGLRAYVYKCVPILMVNRGKLTVTKIV